MVWILLVFLSCFGDNMLTHEVEKIVYEEKEVEVIVEVIKEVEIPVIKEVEVLVEDTDDDAADVWVEHFNQPMSVNGVDILWVIDPSGSMANDQFYRADLNPNKEIIAQGRSPTTENTKLMNGMDTLMKCGQTMEIINLTILLGL